MQTANDNQRMLQESQKLLSDHERLLSRKEAARMLSVNPHTLTKWASNGVYNLATYKIGRMVRYRLSDILQFIERKKVVRQWTDSNEY